MDAKVVNDGQALELVAGPQGVEARIVKRPVETVEPRGQWRAGPPRWARQIRRDCERCAPQVAYVASSHAR